MSRFTPSDSSFTPYHWDYDETDDIKDYNDDDDSDGSKDFKDHMQRQDTNEVKGNKKTKPNINRKKKHHQNSLENLKKRVSALINIFEENNKFIPLPEDIKGKTWSNRNYGQDKKRQRKQSERIFLEQRIIQLETQLREYGITKFPA